MLKFTSRSPLAALAAAGLFLICSAHAAQSVSSRPGLRALSPSQRFVWNAAEINMGEIGLGRLAVQNSQNPAVQDFGRMLMRDHQQNLKELQNIADSQGFKMPTALDRRRQMLSNRLSTLSGAQFDQQFAAAMVSGHREAIRMFENAARSRITPQLQEFAKKSLPTLRAHLNTAESLQSSVTARARGTTTRPAERIEQPTNVSVPQQTQGQSK